MLGFVEMALAAEKDDAMAQQGIANCGHRRGWQIAGQPYTMDLCADRWRNWADTWWGGAAGGQAKCNVGSAQWGQFQTLIRFSLNDDGGVNEPT